MITFKQFLQEATDLSGYVELLNEVGMFITLNTSMIQSYAADSAGKNQLMLMQKSLKHPIINGRNFMEVHADPQFYKLPRVIPHMLKYVYNLIKYVEPRIQIFVHPDHLSKFQNRLDQIKELYKNQVKLLTP
jgi:hypothetical protein